MNFTKHALYRITLSLFFTQVLVNQLYAQKNTVTVKGTVLDSAQGKTLPFATVGLYRINNQEKPVQNIFTDNKGRYEFNKVDTGQYVVYASNTGFAEKRSAPFLVSKDSHLIELAPLHLTTAAQDLAVVTVSARRPLIEQTDEKLIYNAESDPSSEGQTAVDVLRKTPFLSVDGEGNVQLNGQSNFKVLLNGKETAMFTRNLKEALQSFPASLIKKVEVITSPSSKYDGEGVGGLINIITKKKVMGYNGSLGVARNSTFHRNMVNANMNFKFGRLGFTGYYGYNYTDNFTTKTESVTESFNPVAYYKRISNGERRNSNSYQYGNAELSWDLDSLNTVSVYGNLNGGSGKNANERNFGIISPDKTDTLKNVFRDRGEFSYPSFNWGVDFIRKFRKPEQELTFKMYHEHNQDDNLQESNQFYPGSTRFIINDNNSTNRQSTWQADYVHPLNKNTKLEMGMKAIIRRAASDYQSRLRYNADEKYEIDNTNSDYFNCR